MAEQIPEPMADVMGNQQNSASQGRMWTEAELVDLIVDVVRSPSRQAAVLQARIVAQQVAQHRACQEADRASRMQQRINAMQRRPDETIWQFERRKAVAEEILAGAARAGTSDSDLESGDDG